MTAERIQFGEFDLDAARFELRRGSKRVKLERIPMELLVLLASSEGRLVERRELVEAIWGKDHFLESDSAINTAIRKLRRVLGDDPRQPTFIETVPGKGYRFLAESAGKATAEAKALYARGLHFWNRKTPDGYLEAIRIFQRCIDLDSDDALPYLGLAKTWIMFGIHGLQPAHNVYPRARAAAAKALELDGELAEAHAAMGDVVKGYDWDWAQAERHYMRALELDSRCAVAHQWYANLLSIMGRHEEAIRHAAEAQALDPLSVGPAGFVGFTRLRARQYREALREAESAVTLGPNSPIANWFLGQTLAAMNRMKEAERVLAIAAEQSHGAAMYLSALGYVQGASGDAARADEILRALEERAAESYVSPFDLAVVYLGQRNVSASLDHLERAAEQRVMRLTELAMPMFDGLCGEPRYEAIVTRMGLKP